MAVGRPRRGEFHIKPLVVADVRRSRPFLEREDLDAVGRPDVGDGLSDRLADALFRLTLVASLSKGSSRRRASGRSPACSRRTKLSRARARAQACERRKHPRPRRPRDRARRVLVAGRLARERAPPDPGVLAPARLYRRATAALAPKRGAQASQRYRPAASGDRARESDSRLPRLALQLRRRRQAQRRRRRRDLRRAES
jgi:hypothetical protein